MQGGVTQFRNIGFSEWRNAKKPCFTGFFGGSLSKALFYKGFVVFRAENGQKPLKPLFHKGLLGVQNG